MITSSVRFPRPVLLLAALVSTVSVVSCNSTRSSSVAPAQSKVEVATNNGGAIVITTPSAQFQVSKTGYIHAALLRDGQKLSLDDANADPQASADEVISDGKSISDFVLDVSSARVTAPSGRLGAAGKRIEISGKSQSLPALEKTLDAAGIPRIVVGP